MSKALPPKFGWCSQQLTDWQYLGGLFSYFPREKYLVSGLSGGAFFQVLDVLGPSKWLFPLALSVPANSCCDVNSGDESGNKNETTAFDFNDQDFLNGSQCLMTQRGEQLQKSRMEGSYTIIPAFWPQGLPKNRTFCCLYMDALHWNRSIALSHWHFV